MKGRPQRTCNRRSNISAALPGQAASLSRDDLILQHLPQVRLVALRIRERLPASVSLEDLVSAGTVGLIAAIDRFDGAHNVKISTYAEYKIRGAILDALRELDWMPRQRRRQIRRMESAIAVLEQELGRHPTGEEIAGRLGVAVDEYYQWNAEANGVNLASLDSALRDDEIHPRRHQVADHHYETPSQLLERSELEDLLAAAIEEMPAIDQTVLQLYFFEEMTLREIAGITGLHESRVSQLKSRGLARLKTYINPPPLSTQPLSTSM